jgi:hypothetical protein
MKTIGHDVEVVVDCHRRLALGRPERAEHHRGAVGDAVDLGAAPEGPDGGEPELGAPLEVRLAVGVRRDARDLDELLQPLLEVAAFLLGELLERGPGERRGTVSLFAGPARRLVLRRNVGAASYRASPTRCG